MGNVILSLVSCSPEARRGRISPAGTKGESAHALAFARAGSFASAQDDMADPGC